MFRAHKLRPMVALLLLAPSLLLLAQAPPQLTAEDRELGFLYGRQGKMLEALELLRPWALAHPEDVPARLAAVQAAVELERVEDAEALLAGLEGESLPLRVLRAQVARLRAAPAAVLELLTPFADQAPPGLDRLVDGLLADALVATGRGAEAADRLRRWRTVDPNLGLLFAQAAYQSGAAPEALGALEPWARQALSESNRGGGASPPWAASVLLETGRMLQASGRSAEAVTMLEAGLKLDGQSLQGWLNLSQALAKVGRLAEAMEAVKKFKELDSKRPRDGATPLPPP